MVKIMTQVKHNKKSWQPDISALKVPIWEILGFYLSIPVFSSLRIVGQVRRVRNETRKISYRTFKLPCSGVLQSSFGSSE